MFRIRITQIAVNTVADDWDPAWLVVESCGRAVVYLDASAVPADRLAMFDQATCRGLRDERGVDAAAKHLASEARRVARGVAADR